MTETVLVSNLLSIKSFKHYIAIRTLFIQRTTYILCGSAKVGVVDTTLSSVIATGTGVGGAPYIGPGECAMIQQARVRRQNAPPPPNFTLLRASNRRAPVT